MKKYNAMFSLEDKMRESKASKVTIDVFDVTGFTFIVVGVTFVLRAS
jgi:hypothetical protein